MKQLEHMLGALFAPKPRRRPDPHRKARETAKALAKEHSVEIERLKDGGFNIYPMKGLPDDPHEGDHYVNEWDEVLERVQTYVDLRAPLAAMNTNSGVASLITA